MTLYLTKAEHKYIQEKAERDHVSANQWVVDAAMAYPKARARLVVGEIRLQARKKRIKELKRRLAALQDRPLHMVAEAVMDILVEQARTEGHDLNIEQFLLSFLERSRQHFGEGFESELDDEPEETA